MDGDLKISYDEGGDLLYEKPQAAAPAGVKGGEHFQNLAVSMEESVLDQLATTQTEFVSHDESSREGWEVINAEAWELMGVGPEAEPDDADEDGSSDTSNHSLLLTAVTRFMSKSMAAMLPDPEDAVNYKLAFDPEQIEDPEQRRMMKQDAHEAGARVKRFYADFFYNQLPSYVEDSEQLLMEMGLNGLGVRKIYRDNTLSPKVQACFVPASDILISYDAKNFRTGRIAHRMHMPTPTLIRMIQSNQYRAVDNLSDTAVPDKDMVTEQKDRIHGLSQQYMEGTESHKIYEIHCELFLQDDPHPLGLARPYIVTIHAASMEILSIVRNWRPNDPTERRIEHFVGYLFHPGKSAVYGMGLGHLLSNITRALRTAQRRGLEAAYLQNHPSGFKLSNFKVRDDATKIRSGEFIDVDSPTGDIRSALMMHPFEGPSQGLMALADKMEANGKQLGGLATQDLDNLMKAGMAAGPAMAAFEENTEFQTSIHARLYRAVKREVTLIHQLMREVYGNQPVPFGDNEMLMPGDLLKVNPTPKMVPGQASKGKAVMEAQATLELTTALPDILDKRQAALDYLRALGKPNIDDIMLPDPAENPPKPADPVTEYGSVMAGKPVVAGIAQNHMAHIDAHTAQMNGIQTSNLPVEQGEAMMAVLASHIAEHYAKDMMAKVAAQMGIPVEQFEQGIPPEMEAQIAPMIAQAIQQIEADRAPDDGQEESKIALEQVKGQNAAGLETMKQRHAREMQEMKHRQTIELQKQRDEAAMERAVQDDETAIEIASMPDRNSAPTRAGGLGG
jgi:hypothetical protein